MMNTAHVEFSEATVDLASGTWYCMNHEVKVRAGKDCLFCLHESVGDEMFDKITLP